MDGELSKRAEVVNRHRAELVALVGALNQKTQALHSDGISTVLAWDKTSRPFPLVLEAMHYRNDSGDYVGKIHTGTHSIEPVLAFVQEINSKTAELREVGYSVTMAIHKISSARDPKGRPVLAVMEVAPRTAVEEMITREDFGAAMTISQDEKLEPTGVPVQFEGRGD